MSRPECPSGYKAEYDNMYEARKVMDRESARARKRKGGPPERRPYKCRCGKVHMASSDRIKADGREAARRRERALRERRW